MASLKRHGPAHGPRWLILFPLLLSLACSTFAGSGASETQVSGGAIAPGKSSSTRESSSGEPTLAMGGAPVHPMGEVATYDNIGMFLVQWDYGAGVRPLESGHVYIIVDVIIINNGVEDYSLWPRDSLTVRDGEGKHYSEVTMNCTAGSATFPCVEITNPYGSSLFRRQNAMPPGQPVRDQFVFDVPAPCPDCALDLALGSYDDEHILVALGPQPASAEIPAEWSGAGQEAPGPGEIVAQGDVAFSLLEWEYVPCGLDQGTKNCVVAEAAIANTGSVPVEISHLGLRSATGVEFDHGNLLTEPFKEGFPNMLQEALAPGEWERGRAVFEVSQLSADLLLYLQTAPSGGGEPNPELVTALGAEPVEVSLPAGFPGDLAPGAVPPDQELTVGSLAVTLFKTTVLKKSEFGPAPEGRSYLVLDLQVRNLGTTEQRLGIIYMGGAFMLKDGEGNLYYPDPDVLGHPFSGGLEEAIPAGGTASGQAGFEVPTGVQILYLVFRARLSPGEAWSSGFIEIPAEMVWGTG